MADIFNPPSNIKVPQIDFKNIDMVKYDKEVEVFIEALKNTLINHYDDKTNVGEVVSFQVADGYAQYMVMQMKPLQLVHLPLMDEYEFQYIDRLTAKDIQDKIDQQKAMAKLFS